MQQSTLGSNVSGSSMRDSASNVSEKAHAGIDKVTQSAHNTVDRVVSAASSAVDRYADSRFLHTAQDWKAQTCDYVRAHPMTAVGIAVAAGFLLSRLTHFR
jgi:ElaB/YqjD/DUF883 family membrane-anchored ribosome-binding protein